MLVLLREAGRTAPLRSAPVIIQLEPVAMTTLNGRHDDEPSATFDQPNGQQAGMHTNGQRNALIKQIESDQFPPSILKKITYLLTYPLTYLPQFTDHHPTIIQTSRA